LDGTKINIKLTKHANVKVVQRNISIQLIKNVVTKPDRLDADKFDSDLTHYIKKVDKRFLRVIGRWENHETLIVISAFYDRRLKKRGL